MAVPVKTAEIALDGVPLSVAYRGAWRWLLVDTARRLVIHWAA